MAVNIIPLHELPLGGTGVVRNLLAQGSVRRRLLDLGLINNTPVQALLRSPVGDPVAYKIRGAVIALRSEEAQTIYVEPSEA
ncbi:MAG: ferrous iron transport protein A [Firmicutes bacterium]|nr:ferrous iron transport protein A [Bacillota bacterium]